MQNNNYLKFNNIIKKGQKGQKGQGYKLLRTNINKLVMWKTVIDLIFDGVVLICRV